MVPEEFGALFRRYYNIERVVAISIVYGYLNNFIVIELETTECCQAEKSTTSNRVLWNEEGIDIQH